MSLDKTIGFIGAGNMGGALIRALVKREIVEASQIQVSDVDAAKLEVLQSELGVLTNQDNSVLMKEAECIVLAVKPQNMKEMLSDVAPHAHDEQCFVSIAAGIPTRMIEEALGGKPRVVRVMPNTPSLIGEGAAGLAAGQYANKEDLALAQEIFNAVGISVVVEEKQLDAVTGLSGSGPAYFFFMIENLIEAGCEVGLPREVAEQLVRQTALGAARMVIETEDSPAGLREKVTSPGGTTFAGLERLREGGFSELIRACVARATERSVELGRQDTD